MIKSPLQQHSLPHMFERHTLGDQSAHQLDTPYHLGYGNHPIQRRNGSHDRAGSLATPRFAQPVLHQRSDIPRGDSSGGIAAQDGSVEVMLRRKVPGGVLDSAYDGSCVEQPHVNKHILLPLNRPIVTVPYTDSTAACFGLQPISAPGQPWLQHGFAGTENRSSPSASTWSGSQANGPIQSRNGRPFASVQLPQIDSMLHQTPVQTMPLHFAANGINPYAFLPSAAIPQVGPTTSNANWPWGPFWPDGVYEPYRPAAMRDLRYYPQNSLGWGMQRLTASPLKSVLPPRDINSHVAGRIVSPLTSYQPSHLFHGGNQFRGEPVKFGYAHHNSAIVTPRDSYQAQPNTAYPMIGSLVQKTFAEHPMLNPSMGAFTTQIAPHDLDSTKGDLRHRDHVFGWAHTTYIELLRYLHDGRKRSQLGDSQPCKAQIYPKPPPQSRAWRTNDKAGQHPARSDIATASHHANSRATEEDVAKYISTEKSLLEKDTQAQPVSFQRHPLSNSTVPSLWQRQQITPNQQLHTHSALQTPRTLRRTAPFSFTKTQAPALRDNSAMNDAALALESLTKWCEQSSWSWVDGILLGGCLAYAVGDYDKAMDWYLKVLTIDASNVEAISNLAATLFAKKRHREAEERWRQAVKLRPSYFEATEHLIGLLCGEQRGKEAVEVIRSVEDALRISQRDAVADSRTDGSPQSVTSPGLSDVSDKPIFDYDIEAERVSDSRIPRGTSSFGFGLSGYAIADTDTGRLLQLVHAKGNMLYAMGDNNGAARAFEEAVMLGAGRAPWKDIYGLITHILSVLAQELTRRSGWRQRNNTDPILLSPEEALMTHRLCFAPYGDLPGISAGGIEGLALKASIATTSNCLLSLAKIYQDGMSSNAPRTDSMQIVYGVREILALYYLSLALQPSPSTANNVGILLASVQQTVPCRPVSLTQPHQFVLAGVQPGSGVWLALSYYEYGLRLDNRHAHLYTNLGSLLKDIGHLQQAIRMYEHAVSCDENFDIALANLANAVKDQGRINDAIGYYRRAVAANPDFAEAVCGLANALNSVCGWKGRGGIAAEGGKRDRWHVDDEGMLRDSMVDGAQSDGWVKKVVDLVDKQLRDGEEWGRYSIDESFITQVTASLQAFSTGKQDDIAAKQDSVAKALRSWSGKKWEGAKIIRLVERILKRLTWQWYQDRYIEGRSRPRRDYVRPQLPANLTIPLAPTVLPFHTFTCPMSAKQVRQISQRNGLRISCSAFKAPWMSTTVNEPPPPPSPFLKVGYLSSDFNNHPLAHLMQSVFGLHDHTKVRAICYATTAGDNSVHRQQIEKEAPDFHDVSKWSTDKLVTKIKDDGVHILVNLNGYTRGARNEVFAARPAPIQMSFMGFAGTLGAEWCDYLLADEIAVPRDTLREWRRNIDVEDQITDDTYGGENDNWVYSENIVYCRDTFFCCDHKQSAPDAKGKQLKWADELSRRWKMRKEVFPTLKDDAIILGNFNQLYKIEPTTFRTWLRILARVPNAVLWLLRFPDLGEQYLRQTAEQWAGHEVASRVIFTDVAPKHMHIARARVCDLFLDTPECNAHTTAADTLWSGTPLLTLPRYKYKMCSRMAASILTGALPRGPQGRAAAKELIANDEDEYEEFAVKLASSLYYEGQVPVGRLAEMRRLLYEGRWEAPLFDTKRWVRDLEEAYWTAWEKWVRGEGGDITLPCLEGIEKTAVLQR